MHPGEQYSSGADLRVRQGRRLGHPSSGERSATKSRHRRRPAAGGWRRPGRAGLALFALLLRISLSYPQDSDAANNALQAWDMLHGNVLLHGYILGDATYYTLELPLYSITEVFLGLHSLTTHVVSALTYLIVAASAVAVARPDSRGLSMAARCGVVIGVWPHRS